MIGEKKVFNSQGILLTSQKQQNSQTSLKNKKLFKEIFLRSLRFAHVNKTANTNKQTNKQTFYELFYLPSALSN